MAETQQEATPYLMRDVLPFKTRYEEGWGRSWASRVGEG